MKTTYYLCLETGRTATGQLEPPIRPMIDVLDENNKRKKKAIGTAFQTITKHGDIGQDIRSMYVPDKGHVFLQADSAQAEARVVFLLANDEQALRDIDEHDYHALTASWFFGGTEDDYSKRKLGYEVLSDLQVRLCAMLDTWEQAKGVQLQNLILKLENIKSPSKSRKQ